MVLFFKLQRKNSLEFDGKASHVHSFTASQNGKRQQVMQKIQELRDDEEESIERRTQEKSRIYRTEI